MEKKHEKGQLTYTHTRIACYLSASSMGIANFFPTLLFLTFRTTLGVSLAQVTFMLTLSFSIQFIVDALAIKYVEEFTYRQTSVFACLCIFAGLFALAILPNIMGPYAYIGLYIAVIFYGAGYGLVDIIMGPIIVALPSKNQTADLSLLHSFYCWASMIAIIISTIIFSLFGMQIWPILTIIYSLIPLMTAILFSKVPMLHMVEDKKQRTSVKKLFSRRLLYVFMGIMFLAGALDNSVALWASYFAEVSLELPKATGDILGPSIFLFTSGISRTIIGFSKRELDLQKILLWASVFIFICCLLMVFLPSALGSLLALGISGLGIGILWPSTLSLARSYFQNADAAIFAILALLGNAGSVMGPSLIGYIADNVETGSWGSILSKVPYIGESELAMKTGIFSIIIYIILLFIAMNILMNYRRKAQVLLLSEKGQDIQKTTK